MRLHATSMVSAVSPHPRSARRSLRRRPLLSAAVAGSLVATAAAPAGAEETITVRLLPQKGSESSDIQLLPDRVIPASKEFTVVVPAAHARERGTLNVWPMLKDKDCNTVPAKTPRRAQHHTLAMRTDATNTSDIVFRATVPPLEVGTTFCFHVQRTIRPEEDDAQQINRIVADEVEQHIEKTRPLTVSGIRRAFEVSIHGAMKSTYPTATVAGVDAAARRALDHLMASGAVGVYIAAEALVQAADSSNIRERVKKRDEAKTKLRAAIEAANVEGLKTLLIQEPIALFTRPDAGRTPQAGNHVAIDAGVVLAAPLRGDGPTFWVVPYFGVNFYAVPVDRTIPVGDLAGDPVLQRLSLTLGVSLTEPSFPDRATRGVLFKRYPMAALGYRMTHFVRVTAGAAFYEIADKNPTSSEYHFAVAPFAGASLDIDVVHMITAAFAKL